MAQGNELRVFISSTFRDLQEEREHLIKKIFPEIRALCRARGIRFTEVDLRWGLTDEDVALGQVIRTCLEEVDRCRPYFIGITGDRYGYIPTFLDIQKDHALLEQYPWIEDAAMDEMSITEMEAQYAVLNRRARMETRGRGMRDESEDRSHAIERARFYFRRQRESLDDAAGDDEEHTRLAAYQERIRQSGVRVEEFRDAGMLGELIYDDLIKIIKSDFADATPPTPLEEERARHEAFSLSRRRAYIANPQYLKRLNEHAASDAPPLVVYAESGSGKSSLFAYWAEQYRRKHPDAHVIEHYVGIGATATDHYAVIRHVCMEINERFGRTEEIPSEPAKLDLALGQWLGYADHELRKQHSSSDSSLIPHPSSLIIILDGLNQLQGAALNLRWIPDIISPSIRLILSSTVEGTLVELKKRGWQQFGMQALSEAERETIVVRYLGEYHKSLLSDQIKRIASDYKCGHPLFLKTLLEELRLVGRHEDLEFRIEEYLESTGTEDLFQRMLERIEEDHGTRVVREALSLVWACRSGVDEAELAELTGSSRLKLATIIAGLDYHLVRKEGRLTFFHDYLRRAVEKRYLGDEQLRRRTHLRLAGFFERSELNPRTALECVWQYAQAGDEAKLVATLGGLNLLHLLYDGPGVYEVLTLWKPLRDAGHDPVAVYRERLDRLAETADVPEQLKVSTTVVEVLERLGEWTAAIAMQRRILEVASSEEFAAEAAHAARALGGMLLRRGEHDEALQQLEWALPRLEALGERRDVARAVDNMGSVYDVQGEYDRALECHRQSLGISEELGDRLGILRAYGNIGLVHAKRGEYDPALEYANRALSIAEELGDLEGVGRLASTIGVVYYSLGQYSQALECFKRRRSISEALGDRAGVGQGTGNIGVMYGTLGDKDNALECYHQQLSIAEELGDRSSMITALSNMGAVYGDRKDVGGALECFQRVLSIAEELGDRRSISATLGNIGVLYQIRGEYDRAAEYFQRGITIAEELGDRSGVASALSNMGLAQSSRGEYELAMEYYNKQLVIVTELGERLGIARALSNMGLAYVQLGDRNRALEFINRGLHEQREIDIPEYLDGRLQTRGGVLLDLLQQESMPEYLPQHLPGATDGNWRAMCLQSARDDAEEAFAISTKNSQPEALFNGRVLLARVAVAEGNLESARQIVSELHKQATTDDQRAALHYWLWKLTLEPEVDHRAEAERLYGSLVGKTPKYEYKQRLEELGIASHPTTREETDGAE